MRLLRNVLFLLVLAGPSTAENLTDCTHLFAAQSQDAYTIYQSAIDADVVRNVNDNYAQLLVTREGKTIRLFVMSYLSDRTRFYLNDKLAELPEPGAAVIPLRGGQWWLGAISSTASSLVVKAMAVATPLGMTFLPPEFTLPTLVTGLVAFGAITLSARAKDRALAESVAGVIDAEFAKMPDGQTIDLSVLGWGENSDYPILHCMEVGRFVRFAQASLLRRSNDYKFETVRGDGAMPKPQPGSVAAD